MLPFLRRARCFLYLTAGQKPDKTIMKSLDKTVQRPVTIMRKITLPVTSVLLSSQNQRDFFNIPAQGR